MQTKMLAVIIMTTCTLPMFAQGGASVVGGGYAPPAPLNVTPGQLITIFVSGIGSAVTQRIAATSYPLPTRLGGISLSLTQFSEPQKPRVPLLAVFPFDACTNFTQCSKLLAITLQIPFELNPNIPGTFVPPNAAEITASDGTNTATAIQL